MVVEETVFEVESRDLMVFRVKLTPFSDVQEIFSEPSLAKVTDRFPGGGGGTMAVKKG